MTEQEKQTDLLLSENEYSKDEYSRDDSSEYSDVSDVSEDFPEETETEYSDNPEELEGEGISEGEELSESDLSEVSELSDSSETSEGVVTKGMIPLLQRRGGPVGPYYTEINWKGGYEAWDLVKIYTVGDGSCLFHALCNSYFRTYRETPSETRRVELVQQFRGELSKKLLEPICKASEKKYYDILNRGNTRVFSEDVTEFRLDYMQKQLASNSNNTKVI